MKTGTKTIGGETGITPIRVLAFGTCQEGRERLIYL